MRELLLGCGTNREKQLAQHGDHSWHDVTTVDCYSAHNPDVLHDLETLPLPFADNSFDEIHAYQVLEHLGQQGDFKFFFNQFSDFWRLLKPDGCLFATCPHWSSPWAWMDPGHKRVFGEDILLFLSQKEYSERVGKTPMTDYRWLYKADFDCIYACMTPQRQFHFALQAIKPSRIELCQLPEPGHSPQPERI